MATFHRRGRNDESQRKSIVFAVWLIDFLFSGIQKAVGVLLPSLQEQFNTNTRTIGAAVSLIGVSGSVIAICVEPLTRLFSTRSIIIWCGIISSAGLVICSLAPSTNVLVFGLILAGFSTASFVLAFGSLSSYFSKYYHAANSIVSIGLPAAVICYAPTTQVLIDCYGWRGALLLLSGIQVHIVAAALVLRPLNQDEVPADLVDKPTVKEDIRKCLANIFNMSLLRNPSFINVAIINGFIGYGKNGWLVYLISFGLSKGLTTHASAIVVLISGIGIIITRITVAVVPSDKFSRHMLYIGAVVTTVAYGGMYLVSSFIALSIQSFLLGIGYGILGTVMYTAMNDCVDLEDVNGALAWMELTEAIAFFVGGVVTGWLFDLTGSYNPPLIGLALVSSLMIAALGIEDVWRTLKRKSRLGYTVVSSCSAKK